jgi:hypothetical protein
MYSNGRLVFFLGGPAQQHAADINVSRGANRGDLEGGESGDCRELV